MAVFAVLVGAYAVALLFVPVMRPPFMRDRFATLPLVAAFHVSAAGIALALGAFQLNARLRSRFLPMHRWMGRGYVIAVLLGGVSGLALARVSQGGLPAHVGFGLLAVLWLTATTIAYRQIRAGDQVSHRRWMIRSYSLTFAAVTLRLYIPLSLVAGIPFESAYPAISWMCWVPNLVVAEWLILRGRPSSLMPENAT